MADQKLRGTTQIAYNVLSQQINKMLADLVDAAIRDGEVPSGSTLNLASGQWNVPDIVPDIEPQQPASEPPADEATNG